MARFEEEMTVEIENGFYLRYVSHAANIKLCAYLAVTIVQTSWRGPVHPAADILLHRASGEHGDQQQGARAAIEPATAAHAD